MGYMIVVTSSTACVTGNLGAIGSAICDELGQQGSRMASFLSSPATGDMTDSMVEVKGGWMC